MYRVGEEVWPEQTCTTCGKPVDSTGHHVCVGKPVDSTGHHVYEAPPKSSLSDEEREAMIARVTAEAKKGMVSKHEYERAVRDRNEVLSAMARRGLSPQPELRTYTVTDASGALVLKEEHERVVKERDESREECASLVRENRRLFRIVTELTDSECPPGNGAHLYEAVGKVLCER
ncbi:MAG: hypothetical protein NUW21_06760, partial [Elusimicrobia bacterium]|nr:hypothetical protein [Elusimicrobiota bacterium]